MSWIAIWLYIVVGELTALLILDDEETAVQIRSLAQRGWYAPYAGAIMIVLAWPAAAPLLRFFSKDRKPDV